MALHGSVAFAGSNGDLQLIATPGDKLFYWAECVPVNPDQVVSPFHNTLFPYYDDLRTDETGVCADCGIFTQTLGTAPNRQFVIRWKTTYFNPPGPGDSRVRSTTDRRLGYVVCDLRDDARQRLGGNQRHPAK